MTTTGIDKKFEAFLSYAHKDNRHESDRINQLCDQLSGEVGMRIGDSFPIFKDRDDIFLGQTWDKRIDSVIDETTFLVAIVTPAFLNSKECRREVDLFIKREQKLGRDDLIIPILYVDTPELEDSDDPIASLLKSRQHFLWGDLRFRSMSSNKVRKAIAEIGEQIRGAIERSRESTVDPIVVQDDGSEGDSTSSEGFGLLEMLAEAEDATPQFLAAIEELAVKMEEISGEASVARSELDSANMSGKPASAKLAATLRFTRRLEPLSEDMDNIADEYVEQLARVGSGMNAIIELAARADSEENKRAAQKFLESLDSLVIQGGEGIEALRGLVETLRPLYRLSSTMRPVLKRISSAIRKIIPSEDEFIAWRDKFANAIDS